MPRRLFAVHLKIVLSESQKAEWRRKGAGPHCTACGHEATKEALFKDGAAIVIEKYCDGCIMDPAKFKEILKDQEAANRLTSHDSGL